MMTSRRDCLRLAGIAVTGLSLMAAARAQTPSRGRAPPRFRRHAIDQATVTVATVTGHYPFLVDVVAYLGAPNSALRATPPLARDEGILYVADTVRLIALSNQGVPFATDLIFITGDGRIVQLRPEIMPDDPATFVSNVPVKAAMQTVAGTVQRLDMAAGDYVLNSMFGRTL
jgi:uncharacterized membrane protein (UPF0127 family)